MNNLDVFIWGRKRAAVFFVKISCIEYEHVDWVVREWNMIIDFFFLLINKNMDVF